MEKISYINNSKALGIRYNLNSIAKEYKRLKIPAEFDFIDFTRFEKNKYVMDLSMRSLGKTTAYLLLGAVFNKLYGTEICYIRNDAETIKASKIQDLVNVINTYNGGQYIKALTEGTYDSIMYYWGKFYYARAGRTKKESDMCPKPLIHLLATNQNERLKSTFNCPVGDFIIYDEFISRYMPDDEFSRFMDLLSTIIRQRISPYIIMLANNTNINSRWFEEFGISKKTRSLKLGDCVDIESDFGTRISVRLLDAQKKEKRERQANLYFGFNNPKLNAITGRGDWAIAEYKHIPSSKEVKKEPVGIPYTIRIAPDEYLRIQVYRCFGKSCLFVTRSTNPPESAIVFTLGDVDDFKYGMYALGRADIQRDILKFIETKNVYYQSNEVGADFESYILECLERNRYY